MQRFLSCKFCQNWDISKAREIDRLNDRADPTAIAAAAVRLGCRSVAFTYNDPVIFLEYAIDTAKACHAAGLATVAVTAGYVAPEARREFFAHMDAANVDLKAFTEDFYRTVCGAHLEGVLDTLVYLKRDTSVWFEITTLLIPGENDSDGEIDALSRWVTNTLGSDVPLHFTAFHPDWKMRDKPATPAATLSRARDIGHANGVRYVYTGNVHDRAGGSTWCHGCGALLIGRDWFDLTRWRLDEDGCCMDCGTPSPACLSSGPAAGDASVSRCACSSSGESDRRCPTVVVVSAGSTAGVAMPPSRRVFAVGKRRSFGSFASKSTAKALGDITMVLGPPISTMQSTPRPSVTSRAFASQSGSRCS